MKENEIRFTALAAKTAIIHTITYMFAGILAYNINDYETMFSQPPLSNFMRPVSDPIILLGPAFQPLRGIIFALAFYPIRQALFARNNGWLIVWWLLVALGILSTFGPSPGSVEGLIYTVVPLKDQILGLWEIVLQSFLFSALLFYWINHAEKRWLNRVFGILFFLTLILPIFGYLSQT